MNNIHSEICRECAKSIRVCYYEPYEGDEKLTGCHATKWYPGDDYEHFVGYICLECAFNASMRSKQEPGIHGILGGPEWSFSYVTEPISKESDNGKENNRKGEQSY